MTVKMYNYLMPTVSFYKKRNIVLYEFNDNLIVVNDNNLEILKNQLNLPCKISFFDISLELFEKIINILNNENSKLFWYREKNPKNDIISYHAIFLEKEKIKKIKNGL